ncbi:MAG: hypothetical protein PHS62_00620 [Patescibacteria group bacterium]|nr:hypothetical protein [Patescibacteria group bacterium]
MLQYLVIVGAIVQLIGISCYIRDTVHGRTKPNRVTWLLWSVVPLIATAAGLADGVRWAVLPVFMAGFGPLLVFIASFINPRAYWKLEKFDYLCGAISILSLVLWWITKEPLLAIILSIVSDSFAEAPTLIKTWKHAETESVAPYVSGVFSALTSFFALQTFSFSELAFPIYIIIADLLLIIAYYKNRHEAKAVT